ncbi:hypothetical protein BH23BAC1_BH23BAC1_09270 [soil metagenome]
MFYQTYLPTSSLVPFIDSYYILEREEYALLKVKIPPSGTSGMIFLYDGIIKIYNSVYPGITLTPNFIFGQQKHLFHMELMGNLKMIGVHFNPNGFYSIFNIFIY